MKSTFDKEMEDPSFKKSFDEYYINEIEKEKNFVLEKVIGLTIEEAREYWDDIRIVMRDNESYIGTCDLDFMRLNVSIVNDKIISVQGFG